MDFEYIKKNIVSMWDKIGMCLRLFFKELLFFLLLLNHEIIKRILFLRFLNFSSWNTN